MARRIPRTKAGRTAKFRKIMHEWKVGTLHSGSKRGPIVRNQKQAVAIAISQTRGRRRRR